MGESLCDFALRGPHAVGVVTLEVADAEQAQRRVPIDVWYPADAGGADAVAFSTGAEHGFGQPHAARPAAPPATGPFPLAIFSHGSSGLRQQSTFLTTHLASWGCVVAAPDHVGNTAFEMAQLKDDEERKEVHLASRQQRPRDLSATIDAALAADARWPAVDAARIAVIGHSYGGWTATKMPSRDARVRAVCGLAPVAEPFVGRKAYSEGELPFPPGVATLFIAGLADGRADLESSIRPQFARIGDPRLLLGVDHADHFHFNDGIEMLHGLSVRFPHPKLSTPPLPYEQTLPEDRSQRLLRALVGAFVVRALRGEATPFEGYDRAGLGALDPAVTLL